MPGPQYPPDLTAALELEWPGLTIGDSVDYPSHQIYAMIAKYYGQQVQNELLGVRASSVSSKSILRNYTCGSGDLTGDPVRISGNNTVTKAKADTAPHAKVMAFIKHKGAVGVADDPTSTTCQLQFFLYVSGLSGLTANNNVYLTDAGGYSATPGTIPTVVGSAISTTEALLTVFPGQAGSNDFPHGITIETGADNIVGIKLTANSLTQTADFITIFDAPGGNAIFGINSNNGIGLHYYPGAQGNYDLYAANGLDIEAYASGSGVATLSSEGGYIAANIGYSDITNSITLTALTLDAERTLNIDLGTCSTLIGLDLIYGNSGTLGTTTAAYGLRMSPSVQSGVITSLIDLQIDAPSAGGTLTAHQAINQADTAALCTNFFGAKSTFASGLVLTPMKLTAATMTETTPAIAGPVISRYDWTNAMIVALGASLTGDIKVCTLPAKTVVKNAYIVIKTAAGGTTTLTVALGRTSASYIDYIVASNAQAVANTVYGDASGERGTNLTGYDLPSFTGTTDLFMHVISTVSNLSAVTTSTGTIYLETYTLP